MLLVMDHETPLAISGHEIHEMRAHLLDAGLRAAGIPDLEVVRAFASRWDMCAFLQRMRTKQGPQQSGCDPMNDPSSALQSGEGGK